MSKEYKFYPLPTDYPLMSDDELQAIADDMRKHGYDKLYPILLAYFNGEWMIVAGRDRYRASLIAEVKPHFVKLKKTDDPQEFAERENELRKHFTQEFMQQRREKRKERVQRALTDGVSEQTVADEEGISRSQIRRDAGKLPENPQKVPEISVNSGPPGPKKTKLVPELLELVSPRLLVEVSKLSNAQQIELLRLLKTGMKVREAIDKAKQERQPGEEDEEYGEKPEDVDHHGRKKKKPKKKPSPRAEIKDKLGNVVPDHLRDAFADPSLGEMIEELEGIEAMMLPEPWVKRAAKLTDHYGFILISKFEEHAFEALHRVQLALEALRAGVPHAVCPKCKGINSKSEGKVCRGCRGYGHIPEHRLGELKEAE